MCVYLCVYLYVCVQDGGGGFSNTFAAGTWQQAAIAKYKVPPVLYRGPPTVTRRVTHIHTQTHTHTHSHTHTHTHTHRERERERARQTHKTDRQKDRQIHTTHKHTNRERQTDTHT